MGPFGAGLPCYVKMLQLKRANALSRSQRMAAIALTIIILLNYLAFYYAYGAFEGSVGTKKKSFFPAKNPVDARREVVPRDQRRGIIRYYVEYHIGRYASKTHNTQQQHTKKN